MSLRLPSEIVAETVLPTLRAMLAKALDERGLTQQEIADHLGVTQAAVSNYVGGTGRLEPRIRTDPRTEAAVERIAEGLATGGMDNYDALAELLSLIHEFENRGPICDLHEEAMPSLRGMGCDLCVRGTDADVGTERDALAAVRQAARLLASTPGMAEMIPNVGTNVGAALPRASEETDVAAIPGRIYAVRGRVEIPANPEFGASHHVAELLLAATSVDPSIRGAVNVATDDGLLSAARSQGIDPLEFDPGYGDRAERLHELFAEHGVSRIVFHRGAFGIEPITYVLGETAVEAAELVVNLLTD